MVAERDTRLVDILHAAGEDRLAEELGHIALVAEHIGAVAPVHTELAEAEQLEHTELVVEDTSPVAVDMLLAAPSSHHYTKHISSQMDKITLRQVLIEFPLTLSLVDRSVCQHLLAAAANNNSPYSYQAAPVRAMRTSPKQKLFSSLKNNKNQSLSVRPLADRLHERWTI